MTTGTRRRRAAAGSLLATAALALAGCGSGAGTASASDEDTMIFGAMSQPATLDPTQAEWGNRATYYQVAYDTLLRGASDGELEPWLATDWAWSDDDTELTLELRDDVDFSDGSHLTSADVVDSLTRFRDGTSPDANNLARVEEITANGDYEVTLHLTEPDPAMLTYLSRDPGLIASSQAREEGLDFATHTAGSGPYVLNNRETVTGTTYVYDANPDYWNPDVQHYDRFQINVYADTSAAVNAIMANEADAVKLADNNNLDQVEASGWSVVANVLDFQGLLLFDRDGQMAPELADVRVRQALNYAIDREAMLEAVQHGAGSVTTQVFPITSEAYLPELDDYYDYDPDKARELLAEAGYEDGFTLEMPMTSGLGTSVYTFISQQLSEIGITVNYTDTGNNFIADILAPKYPATFMALEENSDWQLAQFMLSPESTWNPFGVQDPEVDAYLEQMQYGDDERVEAAKALNRYMVEEAWFSVWYRIEGSIAVAPGTSVDVMATNAVPSIYDIKPEGAP